MANTNLRYHPIFYKIIEIHVLKHAYTVYQKIHLVNGELSQNCKIKKYENLTQIPNR